MGIERLHMHRPIPSGAHDLRQPLGRRFIRTVLCWCFDDLGSQCRGAVTPTSLGHRDSGRRGLACAPGWWAAAREAKTRIPRVAIGEPWYSPHSGPTLPRTPELMRTPAPPLMLVWLILPKFACVLRKHRVTIGIAACRRTPADHTGSACPSRICSATNSPTRRVPSRPPMS